MLRGLSLIVALICQAAAVCYLEDANAECQVCWFTINDGANKFTSAPTECPDGIFLKWVSQPPEEMVADKEYEVEYEVGVQSDAYDKYTPVTQNNGYTIPHANIHSCIANGGACTPFVSKSPKLSTHTAALKANFTNYTASLVSMVKLPESQYTIIAHGRFFMKNEENSSLPDTKVDIAIGVSRSVIAVQAMLTSDSYVTAVVVGCILLIFIGASVYAAKKGIVNAEAFLQMVTGEVVVLLCNMVLGIGDVLAFTLSLLSIVGDPDVSQELYSILPLAAFFAILAWLVSFYKLYNDGVQLYVINMFKNGDKKKMANHVAGLAAKKGDDPELKKTYSQKVIGDESMDVVVEFAKQSRALRRQWHRLLAIVTESLPLGGITIFIMLNVEKISIVNILALVFAALVLGVNGAGLTNFARIRRLRDTAREKFEEKYGAGSSLARSAQIQPLQPLA